MLLLGETCGIEIGASIQGFRAAIPLDLPSSPAFDVTIYVYGGSSSVAERLTVAQDVVGSIPTRRPILQSPQQPNLLEIADLPGLRDLENQEEQKV